MRSYDVSFTGRPRTEPPMAAQAYELTIDAPSEHAAEQRVRTRWEIIDGLTITEYKSPARLAAERLVYNWRCDDNGSLDLDHLTDLIEAELEDWTW